MYLTLTSICPCGCTNNMWTQKFYSISSDCSSLVTRGEVSCHRQTSRGPSVLGKSASHCDHRVGGSRKTESRSALHQTQVDFAGGRNPNGGLLNMIRFEKYANEHNQVSDFHKDIFWTWEVDGLKTLKYHNRQSITKFRKVENSRRENCLYHLKWVENKLRISFL